MNRKLDGSYQIDPKPGVRIFENQKGEITIEVDDMPVSIPLEMIDEIAHALLGLAHEIENDDRDWNDVGRSL